MKPKVIVFGAGSSGEVYIQKQKNFEILALTDNDEKKHGKLINGIKVIPPNEILSYCFDFIVIASGHVKAIKNQLINDFRIESKKIYIPSKNEFKLNANIFLHNPTYEFATRIFKELVTILNSENVNYFADYGTLLGLVRDKGLIKWDDDIDLSVLREHYDLAKSIIEKHLPELNEKFHCEWVLKEEYNPQDELTAFLLYPTNCKENIVSFIITMFIVDIIGEAAYQLVSSVPKIHFESADMIEFENLKVRVPAQYEQYLTLQYGNWRVPAKDITYERSNIKFNSH